ncbi:MAG: LPS-assembly protein LptD [Calditrichaeota bacterium]|nr:LPS-assembly protein LptD [Calditrichota bacterium]
MAGVLIAASDASAQLRQPTPFDTSAVTDTVRATPAGTDTVALDTAAADTLRRESDLDTSITYGAAEIRFLVPERRTMLTGNAWVKYKGMELDAHRIVVDWRRNLLRATVRYDTVYTDSTRSTIDSLAVIGLPTFKDGSQTIHGALMKINIRTKEGYVEDARTEYGIGFYRGRQVQKVSEDVLFVKDGYFTTSEQEPPDYKFTGDEMKMVWGEKVVGKPVVLRFGDVPVFGLPFGVFSIKRGRHSGLIVPTYGDDSRRGRHLKDLGYYWAASDYWDLTTTLDFYERSGVLLKSDLNYRDRHRFDGGVSGSVNNRTPSGGSGVRWDVTMRHNHDIDRYTKLRVNGTFVSSGSYYSEISDNANRRLDQRIRSNATLTHRWPESGSMSLNLTHTQNLATGENSQTLPNLSYTMDRIYLFPSATQRKREEKDLLYEPPEPRTPPGERNGPREREQDRWYNTISLSYNSRLENQREEGVDGPLDVTWRSGIEHSARLNAPQKLFRYFNVNPSIRYSEDWFNERRRWHLDENGNAYSTQERGFFQRRTFSGSVSATTKLYGYFPINRFTVQTVRHVLTPNLSFSYQPDFSDPIWGYYQSLERTVIDTSTGPIRDYYQSLERREIDTSTGETIHYSGEHDRYQGTLPGGTPRGKRLSLNMSLDNLFQMKRVRLNDEGEEVESKMDLFTYNLATSYNFAADSLHFSNLSASLRANPISGKTRLGPLERLNIDLSTTHSFYQYDIDANREVDRFYWEREDLSGLNLLRMTSFQTSSSFTLSGKSPFVRAPEEEEAAPDTAAGPPEPEEIRDQIRNRFRDPSERGMRDISGGKPWTISGSIRYNLSMNNPMQPRENLYIDGTISLNLTERWQFRYSTRVDLKTREVVTSNLSVHRDLKSWEASFRWSPKGIGQGFYLRIGIKAPMLRDVQVEQRRGQGALSQF